MIRELERLNEALEAAVARCDALALAQAAAALEIGLRRMYARLDQVRADLGLPPSRAVEMQTQDMEATNPVHPDLTPMELLEERFAEILWGRWRPELHPLYQGLGLDCLRLGHVQAARVLFGQALATEPFLPSGPEHGRAPLTLYASAPTALADDIPSHAIWHEANQRHLVTAYFSGQVHLYDENLVHQGRLDLPVLRPFHFFKGSKELTYLCDSLGHKVVGLGPDLSVMRTIHLGAMKFSPQAGGQPVPAKLLQPFYGSTDGTWMYLTVGRADVGPKALMRIPASAESGPAQFFDSELLRSVFSTCATEDGLLVLHYMPTRLLRLRAEGHGLRLQGLLPLPKERPCEPLSCLPWAEGTVLGTANSLILLDKGYFPLCRHDQINTAAKHLRLRFKRFAAGRGGLLLVSDENNAMLHQIDLSGFAVALRLQA